MSNSHLFLKSGFIRTPLQNGIGRYIPQLQRITLKFCKNHGGSRGVRLVRNNITLLYYRFSLNFLFIDRDFIENGLIDYAKKNPGTVVYLKPRRHRSPVMVAEYCQFKFVF